MYSLSSRTSRSFSSTMRSSARSVAMRDAAVFAGFVEQRRGAVDEQRRLLRAALRARSAPASARARAARRRACARAAAAPCTASRMCSSGMPGKFGVQVVRRLPQIVRRRCPRRRRSPCATPARRRPRRRRAPSSSSAERTRFPCRMPSRRSSAAQTRRGATRATAPATRRPARLRRARACRRRAEAALRRPRRRAPDGALRAADRRRTGSRDRSESVRPTCAAAAGSPALRARRACCGPWPTTHPDRHTCARRAEPTGSPVSMYSATSAARICAALCVKAGTCRLAVELSRVLDRLYRRWSAQPVVAHALARLAAVSQRIETAATLADPGSCRAARR